jgi:hypothetical protein
MPHGDVFLNWRVVMAAAAVVESLRVKAGWASTLGGHYRLKPDGRRLRAKVSQRSPCNVMFFTLCSSRTGVARSVTERTNSTSAGWRYELARAAIL